MMKLYLSAVLFEFLAIVTPSVRAQTDTPEYESLSFLPSVVTTNANGAQSVFATDLDGDADVLSASRFDDKIAWYENTDGLGHFGVQRIITTAADSARSVFATDVDGDGDIDAVSASEDDDKIPWYDNTNGLLRSPLGWMRVVCVRRRDPARPHIREISG